MAFSSLITGYRFKQQEAGATFVVPTRNISGARISNTDIRVYKDGVRDEAPVATADAGAFPGARPCIGAVAASDSTTSSFVQLTSQVEVIGGTSSASVDTIMGNLYTRIATLMTGLNYD